MGNLDIFNEVLTLARTIVSGNNQGIDTDVLGTGYHAGDDPNDSLRVLSRATTRTAAFDASIDHEVTSGNFTAIKGNDIAQRNGLVILADFGGTQLHVMGTGGTAPIASVTTPANPWDVVYDETNDRLFVAFTNGNVGVYDMWRGGGFNGNPTRTIDVNGGVNCHGIEYDLGNDTLIVSDVGDPGSALMVKST